jgi:hypothetical protein
MDGSHKEDLLFLLGKLIRFHFLNKISFSLFNVRGMQLISQRDL